VHLNDGADGRRGDLNGLLDRIRREENRTANQFMRVDDNVFRTYFTSGRGVEALGSTWTFLDLTPLGRQEDWEDSPEGWPQSPSYEWWRRHDEESKTRTD